MKHLDDEHLMDAYYGEFEASEHLKFCDECRARFDSLRGILDSFNDYPIPERGQEHANAVWSSLLPKLPPDRSRPWFSVRGWHPAALITPRWWILTPGLAVLLIIAFMTGKLVERVHPTDVSAGISEKARERVLLLSLSDHLEQSQIVLANVANAAPGSWDVASERDRAHELLGANRLLRQTAVRLGDLADAALLDELERVLLDIANSPDRLSPIELEQTQHQIDGQGLLFKVHVTSVASRQRGERL